VKIDHRTRQTHHVRPLPCLRSPQRTLTCGNRESPAQSG
jgi:hypothetical protein